MAGSSPATTTMEFSPELAFILTLAPAATQPANDIAAQELAAHPPGCNCAVHLAYRKKAARAG